MQNALFFSVSGVAAAHTRPVYLALEKILPEMFPDKKIAFLGNPFYVKGRRSFPLPLLWTEAERSQHTTTRVLNCWKRLNQFGVEILRPALQESDIVITERLGLDAMLYATARCDSPDDIDEAERVHHSLVKMRIVEQGIKPPLYLIPSAGEDSIPYLRKVFPELKGISDMEIQAFTRHEERTLERYFHPSHGQNPPFKLPATSSTAELRDTAAAIIADKVKERFAA